MSPQWDRIKEVFQKAVDRSPEERRAFIIEACASDQELQKEIETLIKEGQRISGFIDRPDGEVPALVCPNCSASLETHAGAIATTTVRAEKYPSSSEASEESRFTAGTLLAGRYRVETLLGRGGMGEVYRATDLRLNLTVALKFLPQSFAGNSRFLNQFRGEVRIARQITHSNVCRVHDIGEAEGAPFICMEYVDGEDLGVLLRRIGRLPGDKAIEISRRLCAGLGAAHTKGILHRDLKPSNIMLDNQGQVRIMDFGLAALAKEIHGRDARSGTPAYMSPEQIEGRGVTVQSDVYSLGLLLFEIFTGKRAFEKKERTTPPLASSLVKDIHPAVDRLIQRCLDPDPQKRPASAVDVARALPGGDLLAEALAAGDTPSPGLVAASDDIGSLSVGAAVACLAFIFMGVIILIATSRWTNPLRQTPTPLSAQLLEQKARDITVRLGYTDPPAASDYGFLFTRRTGWAYVFDNSSPAASDYGFLFAQLSKWGATNLNREHIARGEPPRILFWYRQSQQDLEVLNANSRITATDPPRVISGIVYVLLDPRGRLFAFSAVPPALDEDTPPPHPVDWPALFAAAGFDQSRWTSEPSREIPLVSFDERAAWTGTYPSAPSIPLRIDAAAWKGRPVYFSISGPWTPPRRTEIRAPQTTGRRIALVVELGIFGLIVLMAVLLAWHNHRRGRGDLRGSLRLAAFMFVSALIASIFQVDFVTEVPVLLDKILWALRSALYDGAIALVLYMGIEPYVRRRWPQMLISWTRLLTGARDSLVAGHVLMGTAAGIAGALIAAARTYLRAQPGGFEGYLIESVQGPGHALGVWVSGIRIAIPTALFLLFLFLVFRAALRRTWLVAVVLGLTAVGLNYVADPQFVIGATGDTMLVMLILWVLIRFGVLPIAVMLATGMWLNNYPLTSDVSAWYFATGLIGVATVVVLAIWSFKTALGGRELGLDELLDG